jgi:PAS domain S-box-containing protein
MLILFVPESELIHRLTNYWLSYFVFFGLAGIIVYLIFGYILSVRQQATSETNMGQASEAQFKAILAAMPDIVIRQQRDGTYLDINIPPGFGLTALSEESINRKPSDLFSPKLAETFIQHGQTVLATGRLQTIEVEISLGNMTRTYEARGMPFTSEEILLFVRDITEHKQIEAENIRLRAEAETRAHQLVENARLYDQLEQTAQENARLYQQAQQEIAERKRAEVALEEERASLAQRVEERTAELRAANNELARALRAKDSFLASMSHELRTPLNAILGISEVLLEQAFGPLNERQIKYINTIANSGQGLSALITDILDLAKVETGDLMLQIDRVALEALCRSSLRIVQQKAKKKQLEVSLKIHPGCPSTINADERRMKQILTNLLSNAVKFTPAEGKIGLDVEYDTLEQNTLFSVWDTGIGIPESYLGQLFQPFVQIDGSLDKEYEGLGLGLSLVIRLTQLHRGQIKVESQVGRGSRFTVSIPNLETSPDEDTQPSLPVLTPRSPANTNLTSLDILTPPTGPLLLLAEDNEDNIVTLSSYLSARGFRLVVARTGLEAIEQAKENQPNAILMDIHMPGLDGLEAIRQIRNCNGLDQTPIVALTGFAMPGDRERCLDMGATDYVSKPVSLKKLVSVIEKHLACQDGSGL